MNACVNSRKDCVAVEVSITKLSQLELVEEHMSNKTEDFDEESCIIDGDNLNSNTETEKNSVNMSYKFYIYNAALIVNQ